VQHNYGVYQGAFLRVDIVNSAIMHVLQDLTMSVHLLAQKCGVDVPIFRDESGVLDQNAYFEKGRATVVEQMNRPAEQGVPAEAAESLIVKPDDQEVVEFGGDYEDSRAAHG
jgi:hypothetical protein